MGCEILIRIPAILNRDTIRTMENTQTMIIRMMIITLIRAIKKGHFLMISSDFLFRDIFTQRRFLCILSCIGFNMNCDICPGELKFQIVLKVIGKIM